MAGADSKLIEDCVLPVMIKQGPLTRKQVEDLWTQDRVSLVTCFYRHKAFVEFIQHRDSLLRGK